MRAPRRSTVTLLAFSICLSLAPSHAQFADMTLSERMEARRAIERIYHAHRQGSRPFEDSITEDFLRRRVMATLAQSAALADFWNVPITREALSRELARIRRDTRFPERLAAIERALGNDERLIEETLARATLADRLARSLAGTDQRLRDEARLHGEASWNAWWEEGGPIGSFSPELEPRRSLRAREGIRHSISSLGDLVEPLVQSMHIQDVWNRGREEVVPAPRRNATSVWTGSEMIIWGGDTGSRSASLYDPLTDTWRSSTTMNAPSARSEHTAVWTGSEMIVWGGQSVSGGNLANGSRYDPVADLWRSVSLLGSPSSRSGHAAVWTGSEMVIWGGNPGQPTLISGGRYDPSTDTWRPTSTVNAPPGRGALVSVWTGEEMLIWGGTIFSGALGGRYNPLSDTWKTMSDVGDLNPRSLMTAVWTGHEMIVWGGIFGGFPPAGARYSPETDTWSPTTQAGAPLNRYGHVAVWTGTDMIIWGGIENADGFPNPALNDGSRYDPATDSWTHLSTLNAPLARSGHSAVWTGDSMLVWGGTQDSTGGRYSPGTDSWTPTASTRRTPGDRIDHSAVWTGSELIIWGGSGRTGGRWDPVTDTWTPTSTVGAPPIFAGHTTVWTGEEMIVWGGDHVSSSGGRYDVALDSWSPTSLVDAPAPRNGHTAIWTGDRMIVWGGLVLSDFEFVPTSTGASYDAENNSWETLTQVNAPAPRAFHSAIWADDEMIVWGGLGAGRSGGRYAPSTGTWSPTSLTGAPSPRTGHAAVWTGQEMIVWGHFNSNSGGRYDPDSDSWLPTSTMGAPEPREMPTAVWTGQEMIVWGGLSGNSFLGPPVINHDTGGRYDPSSDTWTPVTRVGAPSGRYGHGAVWTGQEMIVWGGAFISGDVILRADNFSVPWYGSRSSDNDRDGFTVPQGDCNDSNAAVHPGAVEVPGNLVDENCDGVVLMGEIEPDQDKRIRRRPPDEKP